MRPKHVLPPAKATMHFMEAKRGEWAEDISTVQPWGLRSIWKRTETASK
jgi:hypothetical protein